MSGTILDERRLFSEVGFRDIYKRVIYIDCKELLNELFPDELEDNTTGMIVYCYIDRTQGISFRPVALAAITENSLQDFMFPHQEDTIYIFRLREGSTEMSELHENDKHMYFCGLDPEMHTFIDMAVLNYPIEPFAGFIEMIDSNYGAGAEVERLRSEEFAKLDRYRNAFFPDDVSALLFDVDNKGIEQVWVRLMFLFGEKYDEKFAGELLNEPLNEYGCHKGDIIGTSIGRVNESLVFNGMIFTKLEN